MGLRFSMLWSLPALWLGISAASGANADPYILLYNGKYYAYGTNHKDGIAAYESTDLKTWTLVKNQRQGLVLHKDDVWGEKWFWAPEVYHINGKFIIYFTAEYRISCAESASPAGPFVQKVKKPMWEGDPRIDNSLFIDDDGKAYCFFSRAHDLNEESGSGIWAAELEKDLMTIKPETHFRCLWRTEPWENVKGKIMEGPFVLKHKDKYYLTYSANDCKSHDYAIGYAVADNVKGPYIKIEKQPILHRPQGMVGAGHHSFFTDKEGKLRIVFHVHKSKEKMHPRQMIIGEVYFDNHKMRIKNDFIIPKYK